MRSCDKLRLYCKSDNQTRCSDGPYSANCRHLQALDVRGCPIAKNPKHREHITLLSESLVTLNDKAIKPHERKFLVQLQMRRMQKRAVAQQAAGASHSSTSQLNLSRFGH